MPHARGICRRSCGPIAGSPQHPRPGGASKSLRRPGPLDRNGSHREVFFLFAMKSLRMVGWRAASRGEAFAVLADLFARRNVASPCILGLAGPISGLSPHGFAAMLRGRIFS